MRTFVWFYTQKLNMYYELITNYYVEQKRFFT